MGGLSEDSSEDRGEIEPFFRELEAELSRPARFIEPSAAERARKPTQQKVGRRNARKARKLREPVPGSRSVQRAAPGRSRATGSGHGRTLLTAVIVIACLAGAAFGINKLRILRSADNTPITHGPTPPTQPAASVLSTATLAHPFTGSPAASYADGTLGIVIPAAHPVGSYSAAEVAAAYQTTRKMLIAAHLDKTTLRGGSPDAFANLLISQERTYFVRNLDRIGLTRSGSQRSTRTWVTSFAPGTTQLVGTVIKVHGAMRAVIGRSHGSPVLRVHADYLFVYAVDRPGQSSTLMRVVVRDVVNVDFATYTDPGGPLEPWWSPAGGRTAGVRCDVNDGFVHPQFPNSQPDNVTPTGTPINPYDQRTPPARTGNCQAITGT